MVNEVDAVWFVKSATWTVKLNVPAVVGIPLIMPAGFTVSPGGREPVADHL
jgi:hypothetical protein